MFCRGIAFAFLHGFSSRLGWLMFQAILFFMIWLVVASYRGLCSLVCVAYCPLRGRRVACALSPTLWLCSGARKIQRTGSGEPPEHNPSMV